MTAVTKIRTDEVAFRKARMLIGGKWVDSASGEALEVEDPAHRRPIAEVPRGGAEDVARAVQAAADAFPAWSRTIPRERGRLLARGSPMRLRHGSRSWRAAANALLRPDRSVDLDHQPVRLALGR